MASQELEGKGTTVGNQTLQIIQHPMIGGEVFLAEGKAIARNAAGSFSVWTIRHSGKHPATEIGAQQQVDQRGDIGNLGTAAVRIRVVNQGIALEVQGTAGQTLSWWGWLDLWIHAPPPAP